MGVAVILCIGVVAVATVVVDVYRRLTRVWIGLVAPKEICAPVGGAFNQPLLRVDTIACTDNRGSNDVLADAQGTHV